MTNEIIDSVDINLPPGVLTKMAQKEGMIDKVNEIALLDIINRRLAPKFREMICQQQSYQDEKQNEVRMHERVNAIREFSHESMQ